MDSLTRNNFISSKCTVCGKITEEICKHVLLNVIVCKACFHSGKAQVNNVTDGCFWCLRPGELLSCSNCVYKCCYDCINSNLGPDYMNCLNENNWMCFICDPDPIESLQTECTRICKSINSGIEALTPECSSSSVDISSPIITLDESVNLSRKKSHRNPHDLDSILSLYEKQIKASLELDDANLPAIIHEINTISTDQLSSAIHSFKKCLSAFSSDLTNLESRVVQANETGNNEATLVKLTSLLRILIQHHIFNRMCHPRARIRDDLVASSSRKDSISMPPNSVVPDAKPNQTNKMILIMDQNWIKDPSKLKLTLEKVAIDLTNKSTTKTETDEFSIDDLTKIMNSQATGKTANSCGDTRDVSDGASKRFRMCDNASSESSDTKEERRRRFLTTPSWFNDFKIEKENTRNDIVDATDTEDQDWTDYRIKNNTFPRKRGRPPKYSSDNPRPLPPISSSNYNGVAKRGPGRPKKILSLNVKQPRFYIQKLNGDALQTIEIDN